MSGPALCREQSGQLDRVDPFRTVWILENHPSSRLPGYRVSATRDQEASDS